MTRAEFLDTLRQRLADLPHAEIDDMIADYESHFTEGRNEGRSEAEIAAALGDPVRLAREVRAEMGLRRWEARRTPGNLVAALLGFVGLLAVDFIVLLPVLAILLMATLVALFFCGIGLVMIVGLLDPFGLYQRVSGLAAGLMGLSLLGFGVGIGATILLIGEWLAGVLGKYVRLHYTVLSQTEPVH